MKCWFLWLISDLGDVQITPNDTRFLFSNWGENNTCEEIKRNVAAVQNHSQLTHDNHYNYAKAAQKKKLTLAFMEQMAGGESGDLNLATNSEYNNELSKEAEELKKKREIGEYNLWRPMSTYIMISYQMQ